MIKNKKLKTQIEAATFRRLIKHLKHQTDLQNIDLMDLAGFCRNCLSKWYTEEAKSENINLDYEEVRQHIYGMPYKDWKEKFQTPLKK